MACLPVRPQAPAAAREDVAAILPARVHASQVHAATATTAIPLASGCLEGGYNLTAGNMHTHHLPQAPWGGGAEAQQLGEEEEEDFWSTEGGSGSLSSSGDQLVKLEAASRRCCTCATSSEASAWAAS